ncbi:MAG: dethiobiotin synthase [Thermoguttaceae bacterium]|nr:dethiobiotin synthase [Thermoguttaceae bacterium]
MKKLFMIGTGTDVGKTFVSGLIVKKMAKAGLKVGYFKIAASGNIRDVDGCLRPVDALWIKNASGIDQSLESACPYVYEAAVSPHLASRLEGNPVEIGVVRERFEALSRSFDYTVIEGCGGIVCPLRIDGETILLEDAIRELDSPCLLVAGSGLGTINEVVLTVEYARIKKIPLRGIIFNRFRRGNALCEDNARVCELLTGQKVAARVREGALDLDLDLSTLIDLFSD